MGAMHEQPKKAGGRMRKSILQDRKECFCCGTTLNLERHHVIHGTAGRKIADRLGLTIWLCAEHHRGAYSPHQRHDVDSGSHNRATWTGTAPKAVMLCGWRKLARTICKGVKL